MPNILNPVSLPVVSVLPAAASSKTARAQSPSSSYASWEGQGLSSGAPLASQNSVQNGAHAFSDETIQIADQIPKWSRWPRKNWNCWLELFHSSMYLPSLPLAFSSALVKFWPKTSPFLILKLRSSFPLLPSLYWQPCWMNLHPAVFTSCLHRT